ncbi:hypothetical protein B2G88_01035 [Natronolimnobius baerhuensis]|uniref:Uncharacterized protein n=1 Tax=Natronolimnobius baerhuensis TaxID=253108 RepID=A0A202EB38_9EURY|nr:hypothetical protein B2G88_01035 [Natronolimnobius baerhuensis]
MHILFQRRYQRILFQDAIFGFLLSLIQISTLSLDERILYMFPVYFYLQYVFWYVYFTLEQSRPLITTERVKPGDYSGGVG